MNGIASQILPPLGAALAFAAAGYAWVALWAARAGARRAAAGTAAAPAAAVSVLKPLHGAEPNLYGNLRGFCEQRHPRYQIVFGVREADDPAIAVVERLRGEFPHVAIDLVVDPRVYGSNLKVSNLINILARARHDLLVLADSDISVPPDYLARVAAPLADPRVGIVTCLYRGIARGGFWQRLGRLFIDDWFAPSVRLSHAFGSTRFAFGSTIALRRDVLRAIGGFEALRDTLADDFWLGELTRRAGLRTVLSDLLVGTEVGERRFSALWAREVRWLRTIRAIAPWGFALSFVCFTSPLLALALALSPTAGTAALALAGAFARVALHVRQWPPPGGLPRGLELALIPVRDALTLLEWAVALTGWRVKWRDQVLHARSRTVP